MFSENGPNLTIISAVATLCNNIAKDLPIEINDPESLINLIYIDDVVEKFIRLIDSVDILKEYDEVYPKYQITVGDLASLLYKFKESRDNLITEDVEKAFKELYIQPT